MVSAQIGPEAGPGGSRGVGGRGGSFESLLCWPPLPGLGVHTSGRERNGEGRGGAAGGSWGAPRRETTSRCKRVLIFPLDSYMPCQIL